MYTNVLRVIMRTWRDFPHRLYILFECDIVDLEIGRKTLEGIRLDEDAVLKTVGV